MIKILVNSMDNIKAPVVNEDIFFSVGPQQFFFILQQ